MPISKPFKFLLLCCLALCGFWVGFLQPASDTASTELSSKFQTKSINSYKNLPCPSPEEYKKLADKIHLEIPKGSDLCDDSHKAMLGKVLLLMDQLQVNPPVEWLPEIQADLKNLLDFVANNAAEVKLDLTIFNAVAINQSEDRRILLGGYMFQTPPLEAVSALVHEARHSVQSADKHATCLMGDIPLRDGGCDQTFSTSAKDAGAYSYDILHQALLGLYSVGLLQSDREYLYSSALATLANRINEIPAVLGKKQDVVIALNNQGDIFSVDLRNKKMMPIPLKFADKEERPVRIDFAFQASGLLIMTNKFNIYTWDYTDGLGSFFAMAIPKGQKIYDFSRGVLPGEGNRTRYFLKTDRTTYQTIQLLPETLKMGLVRMNRPEEKKPYPEFRRFFLAMYGETIFLADDGRLFMLTHDPYPETLFLETPGLQDPRGWLSGTGGVTYTDIFLLNNAGELKVAKATYHEDVQDQPYSIYELAEKDFRIPGRAIKYFQGMKYHAQLNDAGEIYVREYGTEKQVKVSGKDIVDFTIIHNPSFSSKVVPTYKLPKPKK